MNRQRAEEIVCKVFYANFNIFPTQGTAEERYFHIGRMIGEMQKTLEIELAKEVEREEGR